MSEISVKFSPPEIDDYLRLREVAGLRERTREAAGKGLANSLYAITLYNDTGSAIGMGRVIGDGGCNFEVVDVAVDPAYQGNGYGRLIMAHISDYLQKNVPEHSYVCLIANTPWLYEKFGFELCAPRLQGMQLRRRPRVPAGSCCLL